MSRAATRRKIKQLLKEQEELLSDQYVRVEPISIGYQGEESLFSSSIQTQQPHTSANKDLDKDILTGVNSQPLWDSESIISAQQKDLQKEDLPLTSTGLILTEEAEQNVDKIDQADVASSDENDITAPVLLGIEKLESTGQTIHKPSLSTSASVITEFDADSLPDEATLVNDETRDAVARVSSLPLDTIKTESVVKVVVDNVLDTSNEPTPTPVIPDVEGFTKTPRSMIAYTKDTDLTNTEHHLSNKGISFGAATYLRCASAKNNAEHKTDNNTVVIEKKKRKLLGGVFSKKKLNEQVFIVRENGHIESALHPEMVLTSQLVKGTTITFAKKNPTDQTINQRWIARLCPDKKSYTFHCSIIPTLQLVRSSDMIGSRVVLDDVESKWILKAF
ncbi:hypothetical protein AKO1_005739 [Acrasis kona]|uniref:Uncharacterized protein n=1 Tax=Acrasis kona TaxID=1008807 RepID=A0AAW2YJT8_9EUKA